jgi:tyrosyl-tRNA synthetase
MNEINILKIFKERGFIEQVTHEKEIEDYISAGNVTCYIGFDPTASSFHVGSLVPIMALSHMQKNGHKPIALVGGGTGMIGDPSGKTEMRTMLTLEKIEENMEGLRKQLSNFINFSDNNALLLNNADWLLNINYINFLRDIGKYFSVNKMIKSESYKTRMESEEGLSFIEFNYMILQAYDFLELFKNHNCKIQMGGSDQWGNIVAGLDLVRRLTGETVFGITFPLLVTSSGTKMGKTEKGAVWLDPNLTSPYDYYQFWINTDDRDVHRFLAFFTFLPMDEIDAVKSLEGSELNNPKAVLAYEATMLAHGKKEADNAFKAAASMFGTKIIPENLLKSSLIPRESSPEDASLPCFIIKKNEIKEGIPAFKLFNITKLTKSGGEARRLIKQGGAYINGKRLKNPEHFINIDDFINGEILLKAGKKRYYKVKIEG